MKQAAPWKVGLPFAAGAIIAGASWYFSRQPLALLAAVILVIWGAVWVYGAWRSLADTARAAAAPPFAPPGPGRAVVISRARRPFSRCGYLIVSDRELLFWREAHPQKLKPGDTINLTDPALSGAPPRALTPIAEVDRLQHKSGLFGGDTLTLKRADGASIRLKLTDPEAFVLIMELFEKNARG